MFLTSNELWHGHSASINKSSSVIKQKNFLLSDAVITNFDLLKIKIKLEKQTPGLQV